MMALKVGREGEAGEAPAGLLGPKLTAEIAETAEKTDCLKATDLVSI